MRDRYACGRRNSTGLLWAYGFFCSGLMMIGPGCTSCRQGSPVTEECLRDSEEQICTEPQLPDAQLERALKVCHKAIATKTPSIQAYYVDQTFGRELFLADIVSDDAGQSECAPGPYLFDHDNEMEAEGKRWQLNRMPNYFLLHLGASTNEENFYIANHNGFPINCQSFKLQQQKYSTLVLVPKAKLEAQKSYYLYLILNQGESRQTWIQPITLASSEE